MDIKVQLAEAITKALKELGIEGVEPNIEHPKLAGHGDYSSNVALATFSNAKFKMQSSKFKNPLELAQAIQNNFKFHPFDKLRTRISNSRLQLSSQSDGGQVKFLDRVEVVPPGFLNFWLSKECLIDTLRNVLIQKDQYGKLDALKGNRVMVEYAHPNTHKEMHIGHMRTLITGEALSRLQEACGAAVFRANYQGDIGPHVAKAMYGIEKLLSKRHLRLEEVDKMDNRQKARFLGEAYVIGNKDYETHKSEIDELNRKLYEKAEDVQNVYRITRQWSLDYFDDLYKKFYTRFDRLFFESEVSDCGKEIVLQHVGKIFAKSEGAIIFPGEKYGLHNRVFVTAAGYPTYEGKDMCLGFEQYNAFPFDRNIHVVASEQAEYFRVVIKALSLLDAEKFKDKQYHLSMGMVHLSDKKMSSRTGEVLTVDWLIDQVKSRVVALMEEGRIEASERAKTAEEITIGAIKFSVLKVSTTQDVVFDVATSVSLEGNSGPYVQYTYARTQSVLRKANTGVIPNLFRDLKHYSSEMPKQVRHDNAMEQEEIALLRILHRFPEVVKEAAGQFASNLLCTYLFDLSQTFNLFYQKHSILSSANSGFRINLTAAVGQTLKNGLNLLGIKAPERM